MIQDEAGSGFGTHGRPSTRTRAVLNSHLVDSEEAGASPQGDRPDLRASWGLRMESATYQKFGLLKL